MGFKKNKPILLYCLMNLLFFIGIGGMYGGSMLIADPSGKILELDINYIHTTFSKII